MWKWSDMTHKPQTFVFCCSALKIHLFSIQAIFVTYVLLFCYYYEIIVECVDEIIENPLVPSTEQ